MEGDEPQERVSEWVTTVDTVFPNQTNPVGSVFGGRLLQLMDVNAAVACARFCRKAVVTASTEPIDFRTPIHVGEIIEVKSRVVWTGTTSMIVRCEVHGENPLSGDRRLCTIGHLNFVALDQDGRPTPVPRLRVHTELEKRTWETGSRCRVDLERCRHVKYVQSSR